MSLAGYLAKTTQRQTTRNSQRGNPKRESEVLAQQQSQASSLLKTTLQARRRRMVAQTKMRPQQVLIHLPPTHTRNPIFCALIHIYINDN